MFIAKSNQSVFPRIQNHIVDPQPPARAFALRESLPSERRSIDSKKAPIIELALRRGGIVLLLREECSETAHLGSLRLTLQSARTQHLLTIALSQK